MYIFSDFKIISIVVQFCATFSKIQKRHIGEYDNKQKLLMAAHFLTFFEFTT